MVDRRALLLAAALQVVGSTAAAQEWLGILAIIDAETWHTGGRSILLTRDRPTAIVGRAFVLAVVQPSRGVQLQVGPEIEAASDEAQVDIALNHLTLQIAATPLAVVNVGRFAHPVGAFGARRFSPVNPLIGRPDGYPVTYPVGATLSGALARFDYRAGVVSLPPSNTAYVPEPGIRGRPLLGAGVTPTIGLRIGGSWTAGPYLSESDQGTMPAGSDWHEYHARVAAFDLRFARGYFELFAELALSSYDVPTFTQDVNGTTYYVEAKYTWSPRFFTAARWERNRYAFIRHTGTAWQARATEFYDGEVGVGYRVGAGLLVKASYRRDDWEIAPAQQAFLGEGWAAALQISYQLN